MDTPTQGPGYLSAEAILAADDIQETDVSVPEWGGKVRVRGFSLNDLLHLRKEAGNDERAMMVAMLAAGLVHPTLSRDQAEAMLSRSAAACQRIVESMNILNGLTGAGGSLVAATQQAFPAGPVPAAGTDLGEGPGDDQGDAAPEDVAVGVG
jgi:hypothetical protein